MLLPWILAPALAALPAPGNSPEPLPPSLGATPLPHYPMIRLETAPGGALAGVPSRPYLLGATEVTQGLWTSVMGSNPSRFTACGEDCPVERVSWCDAVVFANKLSLREGLTPAYAQAEDCAGVRWDPLANGYRLPTEAEWMGAARVGTPLEEPSVQTGASTRPVGKGAASPLGLHDLRTNVWEWVWDARGEDRLRLGGAWAQEPPVGTPLDKSWNGPSFQRSDLGLRLARNAP